MPVENGIRINSEIGKLKAVLLHKPGNELERLTPEYLAEMLFDDIPWLKKMEEEHDGFAKALRDRGVQVYYVEELLGEVLQKPEAKSRMIKEVLDNCDIENPDLREVLINYLQNLNCKDLASKMISGLPKTEVQDMQRHYSLVDYINEEYPFYINPLPNLYFTRDPGSVIGNGLSINRMKINARKREGLFLKYIYKYHPLFNADITPLWYNYNNTYSIEGGDILVLSKEVLAIGCSERTSAQGIELLSRNLFEGIPELKHILVMQIPKIRAFMHLDTVFTMVDYDKFTIYPGVEDYIKVFKVTRNSKPYSLHVEPEDNLMMAIKKALKLSAVSFIKSGGGDEITAAREQWNDSTNTLAIAPGVVITYNRNEASNKVLRQNGIEVVEIDGQELVRGRGGPRCMSMPLLREEL
ncbi:MAG: Arginine deiminase [Firmicutes bacterium]|nr:Arginine deiminase [Bacillota bacterium]MDI6705130.1 arginine deiminase [Bacillota bacterium]